MTDKIFRRHPVMLQSVCASLRGYYPDQVMRVRMHPHSVSAFAPLALFG